MNKEKMQQYIPKNVKVNFYHNIAIFETSVSEIKKIVSDLYFNENLSLKTITATDETKENGCFKIWYIFGLPKDNIFIIPFIRLKNTIEFPSLSLIIPVALNYERKIQTFFGLTPIGNSDLRPIILHENWPTNVFPLRKDFSWQERPAMANGTYNFQNIDGEGIYEIPVGPIHAGIIEPGHFRFSVAGETIVNLEPRLGFTHKGSEKLFEELSLNDKIKLSEKISGDSSFSHSLAFCQALEKLSNTTVPKRSLYLRVIYAEMERLANHIGDIGAIMMDTGFNFGGAQNARLRETIMQINEEIAGSRFLRGINIVGGVTKDINDNDKNKLSADLEKISKDFSEVIKIAKGSMSVISRLKDTGKISNNNAKNYDIMGVVGKAVGILKDARIDYPYAAYNNILLKEIASEKDGDVNARFNIRIKEVFTSIKIIQNTLNKLSKGDINIPNLNIVFNKNDISISIVEGWRGEIVYFITTDKYGNINRIAPQDPSFINWSILKDAGFDNVIPDFPLINKSFNMSYSGNDL